MRRIGGKGFTWAVAIVSALVVLAAVGWWRLAVPPACVPRVYDHTTSGNAAMDAYVHGPECGGLGYTVRVSVLPSGRPLTGDTESWVLSTRDVRVDGNVLKFIKARWVGDDLAVVHDERLEISGKQIPGLHVRYEPVAPGALDGRPSGGR